LPRQPMLLASSPNGHEVAGGFSEPRGGRPSARDSAFAFRLEERGDWRGFRAKEALRAKVPEGPRGHGARLRSTFMREGLAGIERHPAPGCSPVKAQAALAVASELFAAPVENRINWTLAAPVRGNCAAHRAAHLAFTAVDGAA